jgi:hypothetical protein
MGRLSKNGVIVEKWSDRRQMRRGKSAGSSRSGSPPHHCYPPNPAPQCTMHHLIGRAETRSAAAGVGTSVYDPRPKHAATHNSATGHGMLMARTQPVAFRSVRWEYRSGALSAPTPQMPNTPLGISLGMEYWQNQLCVFCFVASPNPLERVRPRNTLAPWPVCHPACS